MKEINFHLIENITNFHLCSDSTGILLTSNNELYSFINGKTLNITHPSEMEISDFYFRNIDCGVIIGNKTNIRIQDNASMIGSVNGMCLLTFILLGFIFVHRIKVLRDFFKPKYLFPLAGILFMFYSCKAKWYAYKSTDTSQPFITHILSQPDITTNGYSFHKYNANKEQICYIAYTTNGGKDWEVQNLPTNFYATSLTLIGNNYMVGTFANRTTSDNIPYHGDGDVYIFGADTIYSKVLSENSDFEKPFALDIQRGVNGFYRDSVNNLIYIYGSETEPLVPKNEISTTKGNISELSLDLQNKYRIIDAPGVSNVVSLSKSKAGTLWITLDDKIPSVVNGYVKFKKLPKKSLYKLTPNSDKWELVLINDSLDSFNQVEFIPNTGEGYVISDKEGRLMQTNDDGVHWKSTDISEVRKITTYKNKMAVLTESNRLMIL